MDFQDMAGRENFWLTTNYCGIVGFAALLFPSERPIARHATPEDLSDQQDPSHE
jgi:hypothetical protein